MFARKFLKSKQGFTSIQAALTFAVAGLVVSVTALPFFAENDVPMETLSVFSIQTDADDPGIDRTTTGSIRSIDEDDGSVRRYTFSRSVLQKDYETGCTTFEDGTQQGSC